MSNKAKIRKEAQKLNPIDDLMFRKMAEDKEFCQEILRVILKDDKLIVLQSIPQWSGTNLQGRSVILDAKCIKGSGTQVDIEVQKQMTITTNAESVTTVLFLLQTLPIQGSSLRTFLMYVLFSFQKLIYFRETCHSIISIVW